MHGFPPAILTTGTRDLLLSNTVRVHRKLREAGIDAQLEVFEGLSTSSMIVPPRQWQPSERSPRSSTRILATYRTDDGAKVAPE
jgi:acetyl esterase/lipase